MALYGPPFQPNFAFTFSDKPQATTYSEATPGISCVVGAAIPNTLHTWQSVKNVSGSPDQGTCRLDLTSVTDCGTNGLNEVYTVHGSVTGTLPQAQGGDTPGTVNYNATF
jgi:hypothetical protein